MKEQVKLVHITKQSHPQDPIQLGFAVTDQAGNEQIVTFQGDVNELYSWCQKNTEQVSTQRQPTQFRRSA